MRFVTYKSDTNSEPATGRLGLVVDNNIHGLRDRTSLVELLGDDGRRLHEAGEAARRDPHEVIELADAYLFAAVPAPPTVRDFMTFEQHVEGTARLMSAEAKVPERWYDAPTFYFTNPYAVIGPHDPVPIPPRCTLFDLELEVAAVVGRGGRDIAADAAEAHIAGYCLLNDWSARDLQGAEMEVKLGPAKGKDTSLSLGGVFVTPDELAPYRSGTAFDLKMTASVNDRVIGTDRWNSMHFSYEEMIEHASRGTEVRPGDVLGSGTAGGGCLAELWGREGFDAHPPLGVGDTVTVTVEHLDTMTSTVVGYEATR